MSSRNKVLDLLDDRYLNLPDVTDRLEPLPALVPFDKYNNNVVVYRTETSHEITMGVIQNLTARIAFESGEEVWTWCTQWEVNGDPASQIPRPSKKPRVDFRANAQIKQHQTSIKPILERRILDPALMREEDMLRILIDIVQVDSSLVPNFIEFLYRWVDFYEGDGMALKAALKREIPSLWDFEYHPLQLPPDMQKMASVDLDDLQSLDGVEDADETANLSEREEELAQGSPTKKMRSKPNLALLERQTMQNEESERLQYREVRYGLEPPRVKRRLPPLINIPQDPQKRIKYYAACFKSRHRALYLLQEAGITVRQIANYEKLQSTHPQQTSDAPGGTGLRHYEKDMEFAQQSFEAREQFTKQREIAISNKLAVEALLAERMVANDGASSAPLIPPTPSYHSVRYLDRADMMLDRIQAARKVYRDRIPSVPFPLVDMMKSQLFAEAYGYDTGSELADGSDTEMDTDEDDIDADSGPLIEWANGIVYLNSVPWVYPGSHSGPGPHFPPPITATASIVGYSPRTLESLLPPPGMFSPVPNLPPPTTTTAPFGGYGVGISNPWSTALPTHPGPGQAAMGIPLHPGSNQAAMGNPPLSQPQSFPANNPPPPAPGTTTPQHRPAPLPSHGMPILRPPPPPPRPLPLQFPPSAPAAPKILIQIYLPGLLAPRRAKNPATDVLLLGHTNATASTLILTHALYLPVLLRMTQRVQEGRSQVLETYAVGSAAHATLLGKMKGIWGLMGEGEEGREERVTKRWRVGRGSVWEGYGVSIDRAVEMQTWEREGRFWFRPPPRA